MKWLLSILLLFCLPSFGQVDTLMKTKDAGNSSASTTSKASLLMPSGVAPTTPTDASMWYDNSQKCLVSYVNGMVQTWDGYVFVNTATKYLDNPTTNTSLFPTSFWGSKNLPANYLSVGKSIRIKFKAVYSSNTLTSGATIIVTVGGTTVASSVLTALANNVTNLTSDGELTIVCTATGTSGAVYCGGRINFTTGALGQANGDLSNLGASTTVNTTTSLPIEVTIRFNSSQTNQNVTVLASNIQVIK